MLREQIRATPSASSHPKTVSFFLTIVLMVEPPCRKEVGDDSLFSCNLCFTSDLSKARMSGCRVKRSEEISSRSLGSLVNPENADERKEVVQASWQLVQPDSNSKVGYSQASRQENVPQATRKLVREDQNQTESDERKYSNSTSSRKLAAPSPELKKTWNTRTINT